MSDDEAVAWLRQQIEGDRTLAERVARRYVAGPGSGCEGKRIWPTTVVERAWQEYEPDVRAGLDFVKVHDPHDVIADCEAKLALLDVHVPVEDGTRLTCEVCVTWEDDEGEHEFGVALPVLWPCMTLEIVAAGYRHRDGYARCWDAQPCPACGKPDVALPLGHELAVPMDGSAPSCKILPPPDPGIIAGYLGAGT